VTGIATRWTGLDFPFAVQNKNTLSYICLVIAGLLLIVYYVLRSKEKQENRARVKIKSTL
jgi:hypothetical protein